MNAHLHHWFLAAAALCALATAGENASRPNIVVIMADDMGYSDIGCFGGEIATPNLDRLAANGARLTNFHNTARCCPSRAALLTGLYPHQAGVGHMVENKGVPSYQGYLNDRCVTIAEVLRAAGYRTLMSGKWHVGEAREHWPRKRGFDRYYGQPAGGGNYFRPEKERPMVLDDEIHNPKPGEDFYKTDAITDYAVKFLDETRGTGSQQQTEAARGTTQPFFLYVAYTAPHWPLHARPDDIAKYKGTYMLGWDALREARHKRQLDLGIVNSTWLLTPRDKGEPAWDDAKNKEEWDLRMAVYAAQVDRMDQGIGKVLAKLKELGAEENTLVMFFADNGGCAEDIERGKAGAEIGTVDSFTSYKRAWANASNTPFRLYKHWVHEGGISSPFIASWPARIKKPAIAPPPAHIIDIMATCLDAAGAEYPKTFQGREIISLEGRSLLPALGAGGGPGRGPEEPIFWEHEGNRAVLLGKWKLVALNAKPWELYDVDADRSELTNLADKNPEKAKELAALYDAWAKRVGAIPPAELNRKKAAK